VVSRRRRSGVHVADGGAGTVGTWVLRMVRRRRWKAPPSGSTPTPEPFTFADFTWLTGNPRTTESPINTKVVTGGFRVDTTFSYDVNHPKENTIAGACEIFRSG